MLACTHSSKLPCECVSKLFSLAFARLNMLLRSYVSVFAVDQLGRVTSLPLPMYRWLATPDLCAPEAGSCVYSRPAEAANFQAKELFLIRKMILAAKAFVL